MRSAVVAAKQCGIDFTMACNMTSADKELYQEDCSRYGIKTVHIDFDRNPLSLQNLKAKKQLKTLIINYSGPGNIIKSISPSPGTIVKENSTIKILLGN